MTEPMLVLFSAAVAAFMVTLLRHGATPELRAAIRTTLVVILGWGFAYSHFGSKSWSDLSPTVIGMLLVSLTAVIFAWGFHFRASQDRRPLFRGITDRVNVVFAVLVVSLFLCRNFSAQSLVLAVCLVGGAVVLAFGSR